MITPTTPRSTHVVFSDVDGTLLDDAGRLPPSWPRVRAALADALVILASSRTVGDLLDVQRDAGITGPLVAENGAVLAFPGAWEELAHGEERLIGSRRLRLITLGKARHELAGIVRGAAAASGLPVGPPLAPGHASSRAEPRGLVRIVSPAEGRTHSLLLRAGGSSACYRRFADTLARAGLTLSSGGRWLVVQSDSSKGAAARAMMRLLGARMPGTLIPIAVGNAANDVSLLEAVRHRFVLRAPDGTYDRQLARLDHAHVARRPGLDGWDDVLDRLDHLRAGDLAHA